MDRYLCGWILLQRYSTRIDTFQNNSDRSTVPILLAVSLNTAVGALSSRKLLRK